MMSIAWIILGYLVIGVVVSFVSGIFFSHFDTSDHVICMYIWPVMVAIIVFVQLPAKLFDGGLDIWRKRKLKKNCAKCARNDDGSCSEYLRPITHSCYKKPREEKKNDQTK